MIKPNTVEIAQADLMPNVPHSGAISIGHRTIEAVALRVAENDGMFRRTGHRAFPPSKAFGILVARASNLLSGARSEEHTSELQSLMRISYAVFCLKKKKQYQR